MTSSATKSSLRIDVSASDRGSERFELARTLSRLRVFAVVGQLSAVVFVAHIWHLQIPEIAMLATTATLGVFAAAIARRLRQKEFIGDAEIVAHLTLDILALAILLGLSGGASNPFVSLLIVPIALAATALSARFVSAVVALACGAYLTLLVVHGPLPEFHSTGANTEFSMHVFGMAVNFVISALLLGLFIGRLAHESRRNRMIAQRERERALRDEGILAIATQAAGTAHELNTPLSTMLTLLAELRSTDPDPQRRSDDLSLLAHEVERCRDILRRLVDAGTMQLSGNLRTRTLGQFVDECAERFRLLRPAIDLDVRIEPASRGLSLRIAPGVQHSIINLLNNAADASKLCDNSRVEFVAQCDGANVEFAVRDYGPGLSATVRDVVGRHFVSDKRHGLGLGLALATSTAARLDGALTVSSPRDGGLVTQLRFPVGAIAA